VQDFLNVSVRWESTNSTLSKQKIIYIYIYIMSELGRQEGLIDFSLPKNILVKKKFYSIDTISSKINWNSYVAAAGARVLALFFLVILCIPELDLMSFLFFPFH